MVWIHQSLLDSERWKTRLTIDWMYSAVESLLSGEERTVAVEIEVDFKVGEQILVS